MVCVYKDTLFKDNMAEIWPKPTLFDFGPSLNKDNMAKNIKNSPLFVKIWVKTKKMVFTNFSQKYFFIIKE